MSFKQICVLGLGYIGLPLASLLASKGIQVHGVDIDLEKIDLINSGNISFLESDLKALVQKVLSQKKLTISNQIEYADAFIISVPTPLTENQEADLSYLEKAVEDIAPFLQENNLIIIESTVPVGTTIYIEEKLKQLRPDLLKNTFSKSLALYLAYCPERVFPGKTLFELSKNARIIGGSTLQAAEKAKELYETFIEASITITSAATAEMVKLTENTFRDINIAFANELAEMCEKLKLNIWEVIKLANAHPRVQIHEPGPGVGGHCIAVDPYFLMNVLPESTPLIKTARTINQQRPKKIFKKIDFLLKQFSQPINVACLGLAFKPNIGDLRNSPALEIVENLSINFTQHTFFIVEPYIKSLPESLSIASNVILSSLELALAKSEIIILLVHHQDWINYPYQKLNEKIIFDTRGVWNRLLE